MAKTLTKIDVTKVDNELYVLALKWRGVSELLHCMSAATSTQVSITVNDVLDAADYTLCFIGINWGGVSEFKAKLTFSDGSTLPLSFSGSETAGVGVVWTHTEAITV